MKAGALKRRSVQPKGAAPSSGDLITGWSTFDHFRLPQVATAGAEPQHARSRHVIGGCAGPFQPHCDHLCSQQHARESLVDRPGTAALPRPSQPKARHSRRFAFPESYCECSGRGAAAGKRILAAPLPLRRVRRLALRADGHA